MAKYLLDENGEVLAEYKDTDRIVVYDFFNTKRKSLENKMFYKFYKDSILIFNDKSLDYNTFKALFCLIRLLEFNTNEFICFNGLPANLEQLRRHLCLERKTLYNHLRKLEKLEIVKKVKTGRNINVMINPYFISYGVNNTDEALKLFSNSVWAKTSFYSKRKKKGKY